ncbi:MAG: M48 family metallopeptidase [Spirochaetes bacterium]|nr:M48 family metallopeptidase [Spirochaetota bacterium]
MTGRVIDKIIRSKRKTLSIEVTRDARLLVRAPLRMPRETIDRFVAQKRGWIEKKKREAQKKRASAAPKRFEKGEKYLYLGRSYPLKIVENGKMSLSFSDGFVLSVNRWADARMLFVEWYKARATEVIQERLLYYADLSGIEYTLFRITSAQKRWGSCNSRGNLHFAWRLVMAPLDVVDYVVVHELAHIVEKNHSARFWHRVECILPDYRTRRAWLKKNGTILVL